MNQELKNKTEKYIMNVYSRFPISFVKGEGVYLVDMDGKSYLDFFCGISITSLGHSHPRICSVIERQSKELLLTSNYFYNHLQVELAEYLIQKTFSGKCFFTNSGTESNETAFKLCRSYGQQKKNGASRFFSLKRSFHGRTTASVCLTGQEKIHKGFGNLLDGHTYLDPDETKVLEDELKKNGDQYCGFFIELIQGEGGLYPLDREYVQRVKELCEKHKILLVVDEVQTGIGRTGNLFCFEHYGITPDIMTLAKALGSGVPIGAMIAQENCCDFLATGQHGTSFGGNYLSCITALETFKVIEEENLLANVRSVSKYFFERLRITQEKFSFIKDLRGIGFHIGIELDRPARKLVEECLSRGLVLNVAGENTIRIMPPLILTKEQAEEGIKILEDSLSSF